MRQEIDVRQFSPKILRCCYHRGMELSKAIKYHRRPVCYYEIEIFTQSDGGGIEVDGIFHEAEEGCINFRRPGEMVCGVPRYNCYSVVFDLPGNTAKAPEEFSFEISDRISENYQNSIIDAIPAFLTPVSNDQYILLFERLLREFVKKSNAFDLIAKGLILQILYLMYEDATHPQSGIIKSPHYMTVKHAVQYIKENVGNGLQVPIVAKQVGMSTNYFHRVFVQAMGITPKKFIVNLQLEKAKQLLATTQISITEVSERCGFDNIVYFDYLFKQQIGQTPGAYRKQYRYY